METIEYMEEDAVVPRFEEILFTLFSELKSDQVEQRVDAMNKLDIFASGLGIERTRNELIPYLSKMTNDDTQVLIALIEQLPKLVKEVGGPEYAQILLNPLEAIVLLDSTVISEKAVNSVCLTIGQIPEKQAAKHVYNLLHQLYSSESFTSTCSAINILPKLYSLSSKDEQRLDLQKIFTSLVHDTNPIVRESAALCFPIFLLQLSLNDVLDMGMKWLDELTTDDQDSIRFLGVGGFITTASVIRSEIVQIEYLIPLLERLLQDRCKSIREEVALNYITICKYFHSFIVDEHCIGLLIKLLADSEEKVRIAAISQIAPFASTFLTHNEMTYHLLPSIQSLLADENSNIRAALANEICNVELLDNEVLGPILMKLIDDSNSLVKLNLISHLDHQITLIPKDHLTSVIKSLSRDKQYRNRLRIIENIPVIAQQWGVAFYNENLSSVSLAWLKDPIYSIRQEAASNLKRLTVLFGLEWAKKYLLHQIVKLAKDSNNKYRLACIYTLTKLSDLFKPEDINEFILPTIIKLAQDPIPNIRLNVAQTLEALAPLLKQTSSYNTIIKSTLETLVFDTDTDVRFFATKAIEKDNTYWRPNL